MTKNSIYTTNRDSDHIDALHAIMNISKLGAAATESVLNVEHLLDAHRSLYEVIYDLACRGAAFAIAEKEQKRLEKTKGTRHAAEYPSNHVEWLKAWQSAREGTTQVPDGSEAETKYWDEAERLSVTLATKPAYTADAIAAQIEWLKEDFGHAVFENSSAPHAQIFDTLVQGVLGLEATTQGANVPTACQL